MTFDDFKWNNIQMDMADTNEGHIDEVHNQTISNKMQV
jgi:hypothetical protein